MTRTVSPLFCSISHSKFHQAVPIHVVTVHVYAGYRGPLSPTAKGLNAVMQTSTRITHTTPVFLQIEHTIDRIQTQDAVSNATAVCTQPSRSGQQLTASD